jgi:hypothetical protein
MLNVFHGPRSIIFSSRLVWVVYLANLLFWLWLGIDIIHNVRPYTDKPPTFEEIVPVYKFGNLAIPSISDHKMISLEIMRKIHQPVYYFVVKTTNLVSNGQWDRRYGSISIGSYVLIATMLLSFVQWGIIAWLIGRTLKLYKRKIGAVSPPSTF